MITINRFEAALVIAGVSVASVAGCRRDPSTASRSAAAYDEAQRQGVPLAGGGGQDHHAAPSPAAGGPEGVTDDSAHAGHDETMPPPETPPHAQHEGGESPAGGRRTGEMDHAAMGHERAAPSDGHAGHAGMDHASARPAVAPPSTVGHEGHGARAGASPPRSASPEAASSTARPGEPAATLGGDALDAPAATSVQEAARSREMAAGGHAMAHGAYRQVDAGRDDVPVTSPTGHQRRGSAPTTDGVAAPGHEGHGAAVSPPPSPNADPHAGHVMPSPRPPSPAPKENR